MAAVRAEVEREVAEELEACFRRALAGLKGQPRRPKRKGFKGGSGTSSAEGAGPPEPPPAAEGATSSFPPSIEAAKGEEGGEAGKHDAPLSDGEPDLVVAAPKPPPEEERQVAITQELAPLEPQTCACGCGGRPGPGARWLHGHATRLRSREQRQQAGRKSGATQRGSYRVQAADPARLAELKARVAAGTYDAGAELRALVDAGGLAAMRGQRR